MSFKTMSIALLGIWVWIICTSVYTVITGDVPFSNIEYNTVGRIITVIFIAIAMIFGFYIYRDLKKIDK